MKKLKVLVCLLALLIPGIAHAQTSYGRIQTDRIANKSTVVITGATPDVSNRNIFKTNNGSPTTITNFANGVDSQVITVMCGETNTTIQNNLNIITASAADITCTANKAQDFTYDASQTKWIQKSGGSAGGGSPAGNNGNVQLKNGSVFAVGGENDDGSIFSTTRDAKFCGQNPYIDVRCYNVRAVTTTPSTTGGITSGTNKLTLAGASTFQNGDGIDVRGAGATPTITTPRAPTVVGANARYATGTGTTIANSGGASTYQYQVVAIDQKGGATIASSATSISNGATTLGLNTVNVSSWTRANGVVTVTTASAHTLVAGSLIVLTGDNGIAGWWEVASTADNTHFVFNTGQDTRNGALASGGATGVVTWYQCNHITWTAVTGAWKYLIYGRASGSMALIGVSLPENTALSTDPLYDEFDDFGSTMSAAPSVPAWYPTTPPVAVKNQDLITTITSGAGTTSLVLAANAGNTVAGAAVVFDNAPNIVTAGNVASGHTGSAPGVLFFPQTIANASYVTNSVMSLQYFPSILSVKQAGAISLGDTMLLGDTTWTGDPRIPLAAASSFPFERLPQLSTVNANPAVYSVDRTRMSYISLSAATGNAATLWLYDGNSARIPSSTWEHMGIGTSGSHDFMGRSLIIRESIGGSGNIFLDHISFGAGTAASYSTPVFQHTQNGGSPWTIRDIFLNRRGMYWGGGFQGTINNIYEQGALMPKLLFANVIGGTRGVSLELSNSTEDTTSNPIISYFGGLSGIIKITGSNGNALGPIVTGPGGLALDLKGIGATSQQIGQNTATRTGPVIDSSVIDGIFGSGGNNNYPEQLYNSALVIGTPYRAFVRSLAQAAPTCSVSAGGTVAIGSSTFQVAPVFVDAGGVKAEGSISPPSTTCTTSSGQQTITISWATVPGAIGYDLYRNGFSFQCVPPWVSGGGTTFYVWSGASPCGQGAPSLPGSGPTSMAATGLSAPQLTFPSTDGGGNVKVKMPVGTATRTLNLPDATGTALLATGSFTNPNHLLITRADGTVQDFGVAPMAVFDSGNRANGTIQSGNPNWVNHANFSGGVNVASNSFVGVTGGTSGWVLYTGASFPTDDQTVAATITGVGSSANASTSILLRASPTVSTGYSCSYSVNGTSNLSIGKVVAGTFTSLSSLNYSAVAGDKLSCNVTGATLNLYVNSVRKIGPITDASISSGFPGLGFFSNLSSLTLSNWAASYGAVSLNVAQTWSQLQTFASGVKLGATQSLTGAGGNAAVVTTQSAPLTTGKVVVGDANNNASPAGGSGTLGVTIRRKMLLFGALCNNATAGPAWSLPTSSAPTANCNTGTNVQEGTLDFAGGNSAQHSLYLPSDWTGAIDARLMFFDSSTSGTVIFQIATVCTATSGSTNDDLAFNTADSFSTITLNATANALWEATKLSINTTGCQPGNKLQIKITRATDTAAGVARFSALELTTRAAM